MSKKFSVPRGTNDILPEDSPQWQMIELKSREILKNYKGTFHSDRYGAYVTMSKKEEVTWDARDVGGRFFMFFLGIQYHRIGCTFG